MERLQDHGLIKTVKITGWLVEQHKRCIMEKRACKSQTLTLTTGKRISQLTYGRIIAGRL